MSLPSPRLPRALLATVLALGLLAAACSSDDGSDDAATDGSVPADAAWSFTDDRGITHALDEAPEVIAAQSVSAGGLWEYGIVADGVFGPLRQPDGSPDPAIGLADPDDFESLGEIDSEIDLEALAALRPDLIVTSMWDEEQFWGIDEEEVDELEQIAPIVGIRVDDRPIDEPLARYAELAESLGADADDGELAAARTDFDEAAAALEEALADKPELDVVAASGTPAEMYIAYPPAFPDLRYYQSLGMQLAEPEDHPTSNGFWETLSWEQAGTYPADLVLADARGGSIDDILELLPATARALPAVEADQMVLWPAVHAYGYGYLAEIMGTLADQVAAADQDVV